MNLRSFWLLLGLGSWPFWALTAHAENENNLPIVIQIDKTYSSNIFAYKQEIRVEGVVEGDLSGIGGPILVFGTVKGNISLIDGDILLATGSRVDGNIFCLGGKVSIEEPAVHGGKLIHYFKPGEDPPSLLQTPKSKIAFFFAQSLCLFLLVIITFYIFPNQINEASFELTQDPVRTIIKGVVTLAVFLLFMFVSFLLMVIGIGMLLFLFFLAGLTVVATFGAVVIFYRLGQLFETGSKGLLSLSTGILVAVLAVGLLLYVPWAGTVTVWAFLVMGIGIVIETRFGTNKQWFTKKTRFWSAD